jgi:hypothetical protein
MPSVEVARPARCTACGAASSPPGQGRRLHGHGVRERMRLGPEELGGRSVSTTVAVRRYRCVRCHAVLVVVPRGVLPRLRYGAVAVALALARWAVESVPAARVRAEVSPDRHLGHDARRGWRSLRRWARGSPWPVTATGTPREQAARVVQFLAGHAHEPGPLTALACAGALLA